VDVHITSKGDNMFQKFRAITRLLALTLSVASLPLAVMAQNAYPQKPFRQGAARMP
jgi:hypothetical protein